MKSVKNSCHTIIIKNSKFICYLFRVDYKNEVLKILDDIKLKYYDATHVCYAYIIDTEKHESDDGEPGGTAGIPMMQVLEKNDLNHVLCIVVRYFGKIKLGAGGLVRAYTKSVTETLKDNIIYLKKGYLVRIDFPYDKLKMVDYLLKDSEIIKKEFDNLVCYQIKISLEDLKTIETVREINIKILDSLYLPC